MEKTYAITHRVNPGDKDPFTLEEIASLLKHTPPLIAIGTNWRHEKDGDWHTEPKAAEEFKCLFDLARDGGVVVVNYQGLPRGERLICRVARTETGKPGRRHNLRIVPIPGATSSRAFDWVTEGLWTGRGRTIKDITDHAGDRIARLLRNRQARP